MRTKSAGILLIVVVLLSLAVVGFVGADSTSDSSESEVSGLDAPENATIGDEIWINATVTNTANSTQNKSVEYRIDDAVELNTTVTLNAGNSTDVAFAFNTSEQAPGVYSHGVFTDTDNATADIRFDHGDGDNDTGPAPEPPDSVADFQQTSPLTGQQAEPSSLAGQVRVADEHHGNTSVELVADTAENTTLDLSVTGNATNVTFFFNTQALESAQNIDDLVASLDDEQLDFYVDEDAGPGQSPWILVEVDEFSTRTLTFENQGAVDPVAQYTNSDGVVETEHLRTAIDDWRQGETEISVVGDVIDAWRTGDPVQ